MAWDQHWRMLLDLHCRNCPKGGCWRWGCCSGDVWKGPPTETRIRVCCSVYIAETVRKETVDFEAAVPWWCRGCRERTAKRLFVKTSERLAYLAPIRGLRHIDDALYENNNNRSCKHHQVRFSVKAQQIWLYQWSSHLVTVLISKGQ